MREVSHVQQPLPSYNNLYNCMYISRREEETRAGSDRYINKGNAELAHTIQNLI